MLQFTGSLDFPGHSSIPRKQALCVDQCIECTPIYRASRFTWPDSFSPRIFTLNKNLQFKTFKASYATFALIINIFGSFQVQRPLSFDSVINAVLVAFSQYCLSWRAILISIIIKNNQLWDGCFGKLKRLLISIMSSIFDSNAKFWLKN